MISFKLVEVVLKLPRVLKEQVIHVGEVLGSHAHLVEQHLC